MYTTIRMKEFRTILDFFSYVKELDLCTTPFCSTCGAIEFRKLCKRLGIVRIQELVEATTTNDLMNSYPSLWYDPLRIMLLDGFQFNMGCPIMKLYEKGFEWLVLGDTQDLLFQEGAFHVFAVTGSVFDIRSVDVLALFKNPGHATLPAKIYSFLQENELSNTQNVLIPCNGKHGDIKFVYYVDTARANGNFNEVRTILNTLLNTVSEAKLSSVAMNGIKTLGYSEYDNLKIIMDWVHSNSDTSINKILLVDKRAGFRRLINRT